MERNQAGHFPRVDLVANALNSQNESISTLNQQVRQYSVGIQLSMPIFAGGGIEASVVQAEAEARAPAALLEADQQVLAVDIRRQLQFTQTGWPRSRPTGMPSRQAPSRWRATSVA